VNRGVLLIRPSFEGWTSYHDDPETFQFVDEQGQPLPTRVVSVKHKSAGIPGIPGILAILKDYDVESHAFDLADWFRAHRARRNDSILVTIESWEPKRFKLELEPEKKRRRQRDEIARKNQELAGIIFDMLETSASESIMYRRVIVNAYMRLSDPRGYPGDHWIDVIEQDPRMTWDGFAISYVENRSLLESFLSEGEALVAERKFTAQEGKQVYRFKAAFKRRTGLWRIIEIQGKQTLADFDDILRDAFGHDRSDHLGGFWKLVRRGQTRRVREVDLGDVNPFGGGSGADLRIAGLGLQAGDRMKYVYDFGDWIEHEITLEAIDLSQPGSEYPRVSDQNKPSYRYCKHCKAEGRKTVATWICIECSNEEQRQVLVCEDCLDKHHEDHYADEKVY
jgi:hypothetical protein